MRRFRYLIWQTLAIVLVTGHTTAQTNAPTIRDEILRHFDQSSGKVLSLSDAMPAELYEWSPSEGVMSVGQVYMHIARYNYEYLESSLHVPAPDDLQLDELESIRDKQIVTSVLQRSVDHVRTAVTAMSAEQLEAPAMLYGRTVAGWTVLLQLVAHMNEHVGQSVAYARMNDIVPPWSR